MPASILIVVDHSGTRRVIRCFLKAHRFEVCGEAADGKEALKRVRKLRPEVVLLDIYVPGKNGLEVAREIRQVSPATKIIFLTVHAAPTRKHAARALGTDGFVAKSTAGIQLIPALERVLLEA